MTKTSVEIDRDIARQAGEILGTTTLRETIHASMLEIVQAKRRLELIALLADAQRFDFDAIDAIDGAWGGGT
jgi:Arc/MetJ family transcription regulator